MNDTMIKGFKTAGINSGVDKKNKKDLGLIYSEIPAEAAAVFTKNKVKAAPIIIDQDRIRSGKCQAIIVNSGNANCCTGEKGIEDAGAMAGFVAAETGISEELILVASTGVIGKPLELDKIESAVPELVKAAVSDGIDDLAEAIMTTDTVPKIVNAPGELDGQTYSVIGIAKGSGMIRPDMATMLCFVMTDLKISADFLQHSLYHSTQKSFNRITVDGDTSTNDMVVIMANGMSGAELADPEHKDRFQNILDGVLIELSKKIVKDGEGATKFVEISVKGAMTDRDAEKIADTVAHSNLVKTALFGEDANWGRILAAAGRAGVMVEPDQMDVFFDDIMMVKNGAGCGMDAEKKATAVIRKGEFTIVIDLKLGEGSASFFTCDFSLDYVKINADYRT